MVVTVWRVLFPSDHIGVGDFLLLTVLPILVLVAATALRRRNETRRPISRRSLLLLQARADAERDRHEGRRTT